MPRRGHGAAVALSRDEIVAVALELVAEGGIGALSVRRLADALHVTPMAIYRHVPNKDAILLGVVDALLADIGLPRRSNDWRRALRSLAAGLRELLQRHPEMIDVFGRQPVTTPAAIARFAFGRAVLLRAGFDEPGADEVYAAVHTYTLGYCALERARATGAETEGTGDLPGAPLDDDEAELARSIRNLVTDRQYAAGLDALLRGFEPAGR